MTDHELLELAAKAAGLSHLIKAAAHGDEYADQWNPLTDDGDALRLLVAIDAQVFDGYVIIDTDRHYIREDFEGGIVESLRRAIVRAAAEIGKETK